MKLSLIAAVSSHNWAIGVNNDLPWKLPSDLAWFKQYTSGKTVIMGRRTAESLPFAPPNRTNLVVSRRGYRRDGFRTKDSFLEAVVCARVIGKDIVVIGGESIYTACLPFATEAVISWVHGVNVENPSASFPKAFTSFPWHSALSEYVEDQRDQYSYTRTTYIKD